MQFSPRSNFGQRESQFGRARDTRAERASEHVTAHRKKGQRWTDYGFYAVICVSAIGSLGTILEDPDKRNARLIAEAKANLERQRATEVAAAEREQERKRLEAARREAEKVQTEMEFILKQAELI